MSEDGESFTKAFFLERYGLELQKIPETTSPSPDFEVAVGRKRIAVLEVKAVRYEGVSEAIEHANDLFFGAEVPPTLRGLARGAGSNDNAVSRVATKIHQASKQLNAYEGPKALVFVNDDLGADCFDLSEALRGYSECDDGRRMQSLGPGPLARALQDRSKIDLYFWIDRFGTPEVRMCSTTEVGRGLRQKYFTKTVVAPA